MKFLIIGASGFVGRYTYEYISSKNYEVIGTRSKSKIQKLIKFNIIKDEIGDCIPKSFLKTDERKYGIIALKYGLMDKYKENTEKSIDVENKYMKKLILDMIKLKIKPIYLSTSYIFNGKDGYYDEDSVYSPISEYGKRKANIELFLQPFLNEILILRLDKIVGDNPMDNHLFSEWYKLAKNGKPILCIKDQIFSLTSVYDIAKGIFLGCFNNLSGLYNLANPLPIMRSDLAKFFLASLELNSNVISKHQSGFGFKDLRPLHTSLNSYKFSHATNFNFTSLDKVIMNFKNKLIN